MFMPYYEGEPISKVINIISLHGSLLANLIEKKLQHRAKHDQWDTSANLLLRTWIQDRLLFHYDSMEKQYPKEEIIEASDRLWRWLDHRTNTIGYLMPDDPKYWDFNEIIMVGKTDLLACAFNVLLCDRQQMGIIGGYLEELIHM